MDRPHVTLRPLRVPVHVPGVDGGRILSLARAMTATAKGGGSCLTQPAGASNSQRRMAGQAPQSNRSSKQCRAGE